MCWKTGWQKRIEIRANKGLALESNSYKSCTNCVKYRAIIIQLRVLFLRISNNYVAFNLKYNGTIVILFLQFLLYRNNRSEKLNEMGVPTEFYLYKNLGHGFALGNGTTAEGWEKQAIKFWQQQR